MDSGTASEQSEASDEKAKRERSKIEFPYSDLEATIEMARVLNANTGGAPCEDVQLAGWMNQTATGGTFRMRVSAGKPFGLIEGSAGKAALTLLGRDAIDSNKSRAAFNGMRFAGSSQIAALRRRSRQTAPERSPYHTTRQSTASETASSDASTSSSTSGASQPDTIAEPSITSPSSISQPL